MLSFCVVFSILKFQQQLTIKSEPHLSIYCRSHIQVSTMLIRSSSYHDPLNITVLYKKMSIAKVWGSRSTDNRTEI